MYAYINIIQVVPRTLNPNRSNGDEGAEADDGNNVPSPKIDD